MQAVTRSNMHEGFMMKLSGEEKRMSFEISLLALQIAGIGAFANWISQSINRITLLLCPSDLHLPLLVMFSLCIQSCRCS